MYSVNICCCSDVGQWPNRVTDPSIVEGAVIDNAIGTVTFLPVWFCMAGLKFSDIVEIAPLIPSEGVRLVTPVSIILYVTVDSTGVNLMACPWLMVTDMFSIMSAHIISGDAFTGSSFTASKRGGSGRGLRLMGARIFSSSVVLSLMHI